MPMTLAAISLSRASHEGAPDAQIDEIARRLNHHDRQPDGDDIKQQAAAYAYDGRPWH